MADITKDIFDICSTPLRLYSDVLPTDKKRKVVPPEEFYKEEYPNEYEVPKNYER